MKNQSGVIIGLQKRLKPTDALSIPFPSCTFKCKLHIHPQKNSLMVVHVSRENNKWIHYIIK